MEPEHQGELRAFIDLVLRRGRLFIAVTLGGSVVMIAVSAMTPVWPWAMFCPFSTPETVAMIGIRRSVVIARAAGIFLVGIAIGVAVLSG
ncbi:MAG TPA: hypothetical protein VN033_08225 [Vulgatibacter sp.]|nr:hypothetical protein [Vulgatibacter sp.]